MINKQILLASGSPRRSFLLDQLDIPYRVVVSNAEEIIPEGMKSELVPAYLAKLKGDACIDQLNDGEILLAADTVVILGDEIIGKPVDREHAADILQRLSGRQHSVISGVYLSDGDISNSLSVTTAVELDELSEAEIAYYIEKYRPFDKAGSYGIQEWIGWAKIIRIEGSYSNIMGLPTRELFQALSKYI